MYNKHWLQYDRVQEAFVDIDSVNSYTTLEQEGQL